MAINVTPEAIPPNLTAFNYCVLFMDILGQRIEFRDQGWLPPHETEEQKKAFFEKLRQTVGRVMAVQWRADAMIAGAVNNDPNLPFRLRLAPEQRKVWDDMQRIRVLKQDWSDGVMSFANLGDSEIKCPMNGLWTLFGLAGAEIIQGLSLGQPSRGAIDGGWGVEIKPNELYGPAVAHAYELESEVAQYPRVVVGERIRELIQAHLANTEKGVFADLNRELAKQCSEMLLRDIDGVLMIHYLGDTFRDAFTKELHGELYRDARAFVTKELSRFRAAKDTKHAFRYGNLMHYFDTFRPKDEKPKG